MEIIWSQVSFNVLPSGGYMVVKSILLLGASFRKKRKLLTVNQRFFQGNRKPYRMPVSAINPNDNSLKNATRCNSSVMSP